MANVDCEILQWKGGCIWNMVKMLHALGTNMKSDQKKFTWEREYKQCIVFKERNSCFQHTHPCILNSTNDVEKLSI